MPGWSNKGKAWYMKFSKVSGKTPVFKRALETEWDIEMFWLVKPPQDKTFKNSRRQRTNARSSFKIIT